MFFLFIIFHFFAFTTQMDKTVESKQVKPFDTVIIQNINIDSNFKLNSLKKHNKFTFVFEPTTKDIYDKINSIANSIVGILGFLIGMFAIVLTKKSWHKEISNKNNDFLSDINKLLIEKPYLWAIYDNKRDDFPVTNKTKPTINELNGQIEAFCYLHLNNFELIFQYPSKNKEVNESWNNYMVDLIANSTKFRDIIIKETNGKMYDVSYIRKMKELLNDAKIKTKDSNLI